ncbi:MAG: hypothetical protein C3F18_10590 [Nitrosomonadales bacterium]|nr:MAG: hypothetical protein C3F18_10590 [Nitrosomonadales bacterium]
MKRLSVLLALGAWALAPSPGYADEALGRLFHTPEQRARMDAARQHERSVRIDEEESAPQSTTILLNGVITRSDGKSTLWINNRIQKGVSQAATVSKGGEVRIVAPGAKRTIPLKVGQSIDMSSGQVEEIYRRPPPLSGNESPPAIATPGAAMPPAPPGRKDDTPIDVQGETPLPR